MSNVNDGGTAFPFNDGFNQPSSGMTLRDYFAAKVLAGICASQPGNQWTNAMLATEAYALADAMLKAREA
jgi:hypothetical protein